MSNNNESLQTTPDSTLQKPTSLQQQTQQISHINNLHTTTNNNKNDSRHLSLNASANSATSDTSSTSFHQRFDFSQLKARLPELNCLHSLQRYWQQHNNGASDPNDPQSLQKDDGGGGGGVSNSFYANNILGYTFGYHFGSKDAGNAKSEPIRETPLQKFYRHQQQKKMPAFRGRRGWCGCFQVSFFFSWLEFKYSISAKKTLTS